MRQHHREARKKLIAKLRRHGVDVSEHASYIELALEAMSAGMLLVSDLRMPDKETAAEMVAAACMNWPRNDFVAARGARERAEMEANELLLMTGSEPMVAA